MDEPLIQEQIAYYRARAQEYEATAVPTAETDKEQENPMVLEWRAAERVVHSLPNYTDILELACGTGVWTRLLIQHTEHLAALDASPEMIALNRAQVNDPRVQYGVVNLFEWEPTQPYDLVFIAFWLSHVPEPQLDSFLEGVRRAMKPHGHVFILDEPRATKNVIPTLDNVQARALNDGRTFHIIKEYYDPDELSARMRRLGFAFVEIARGDYFFRLKASAGLNAVR